MKTHLLLIATLVSTSFASCQSNSEENSAAGEIVTVSPGGTEFNQYWEQGKAELTRYELKQARYGEIREGNALMVFVTEPFLVDKQVKSEMGSGAPTTQALKLNAIRKFNTGIYDYSIMSSVFKSIDEKKHPQALKISTSSQEWCGHTFMQINLRGKEYEVTSNSYFEAEGDQNYNVPAAFAEDELFSQIRVNPNNLPQGEVQMLPPTAFTRLVHIQYAPRRVVATLTASTDAPDQLMTYTVTYSNLDRTVKIFFEKDFPHQIEGWEETYVSGYGPNAKKLTTTAKKTHQVLSPYWGKHDNKDEILRKELGL